MAVSWARLCVTASAPRRDPLPVPPQSVLVWELPSVLSLSCTWIANTTFPDCLQREASRAARVSFPDEPASRHELT